MSERFSTIGAGGAAEVALLVRLLTLLYSPARKLEALDSTLAGCDSDTDFTCCVLFVLDLAKLFQTSFSSPASCWSTFMAASLISSKGRRTQSFDWNSHFSDETSQKSKAMFECLLLSFCFRQGV